MRRNGWEWLETFEDRFFLELQRTGRSHEEAYIAQAVIFTPVVHYNAHINRVDNSISVEIDDWLY